MNCVVESMIIHGGLPGGGGAALTGDGGPKFTGGSIGMSEELGGAEECPMDQ